MRQRGPPEPQKSGKSQENIEKKYSPTKKCSEFTPGEFHSDRRVPTQEEGSENFSPAENTSDTNPPTKQCRRVPACGYRKIDLLKNEKEYYFDQEEIDQEKRDAETVQIPRDYKGGHSCEYKGLAEEKRDVEEIFIEQDQKNRNRFFERIQMWNIQNILMKPYQYSKCVAGR